jgi:hypothetical protein
MFKEPVQSIKVPVPFPDELFLFIGKLIIWLMDGEIKDIGT